MKEKIWLIFWIILALVLLFVIALGLPQWNIPNLSQLLGL